MLSLICVYNNQELLKNSMISSLEKQSYKDYELILVNSEENGMTSASRALNYGGEQSRGDFLVFLHQDLVFIDEDFLEKLQCFCMQNTFGIAGVAGVVLEPDGKRLVYSNITHGENKERAGAFFDSVKDAESLDECLLIVPARVFEMYKFSDLGNTWHLYGTDFCLKIRKDSLSVKLFPLSLWHLSSGKSLNINYFDAIKRLCRLYNNNKVIYTIFGKWPTNEICLILKCELRKIRFKFLQI